MEEREQSRYEDELLELLQGGAGRAGGRRQQRPLFRRPGQDLQYSPSEQDSALTTAPSRTSLPDTVGTINFSSQVVTGVIRNLGRAFKIFVFYRSS